jgi:hypothetical protein
LFAQRGPRAAAYTRHGESYATGSETGSDGRPASEKDEFYDETD